MKFSKTLSIALAIASVAGFNMVQASSYYPEAKQAYYNTKATAKDAYDDVKAKTKEVYGKAKVKTQDMYNNMRGNNQTYGKPVVSTDSMPNTSNDRPYDQQVVEEQ